MSVSQRSRILFLCLLACTGFTAYGQVQRNLEDPVSWRMNMRPVAPLRLQAIQAERLRLEDDERSRQVGNPVPPRYGQQQALDLGVATKGTGTWQTLPDGSRLWRASILMPGVLAQQLIFDQFDLPEGAALHCYSADRQQVRGPYTREASTTGQFTTLPITGDEVVVEYHEPAAVAGQGRLHIGSSVGVFRPIPGVVEGGPKAYGFGRSGACNLNVNCPDGATWQNAKRSVALMLMNGYLCTGALVNNTAQDGRPLFLSANHCYEAAAGAGSTATWLYVFNYESSSCTANIEGPTDQSIVGSTLLARYVPSDLMILELSQPPPVSYDVFYSGWNRQDAPPNRTVSIHHPRGDLKKISFDDQAASSATQTFSRATSGTNALWRVNWDRNTTTEGGSSGSPLFDASQRIIGQLWGGAAACSGLGNNGLPDYYGKMSVSWTGGGTSASRLRDHLDPLNTGVLTLDGADFDGTPPPPPPPPPPPTTVVATNGLALWPNPVRSERINIRLQTASTEPASIQLVQPDGRVVYSGVLSRRTTDAYLELDPQNLSTGLYVVVIRQAGNDYVQRLLVAE